MSNHVVAPPVAHTPGPWHTVPPIADYPDDGLRLVSKTGAFGRFVGFSSDSVTTIAEDKANARLIAAAPDLLQACKSALDAINEEQILQAKRGESVHYLLGTAKSFLDKAIARATTGGQS